MSTLLEQKKSLAGKRRKTNFPLYLTLILFLLIMGLLFLRIRQQTGGQLIYTIDDPYIHMAIAKNLAQHGVWGVTPYEFSSSSSSILWVLLLAGSYLITGPNEFIPLILNIVFAGLVIIVLYGIIKSYTSSKSGILLFLFAVIFLAPFPAIIFCGMEHPLHILFTLLFVQFSVKILTAGPVKLSEKPSLVCLVLAAFLPLIRYESLFLIFVIGLLLLARRQWLYAGLLAVAAFVPIGIFGLISLTNGAFWLPNSVVLKGESPGLSFVGLLRLFGFMALDNNSVPFIKAAHLLALALAALTLYILRFSKHGGFWEKHQLGLAIFLATTFLHLQFASLGWFYRYEAYLVTLGLVVTITATLDYPADRNWDFIPSRTEAPKYIAVLLAVYLLFQPLADRGLQSFFVIPFAANNIYEQQYQMGLFLKEYYQGTVVAASDIGAVNYLGNIQCLDLYGLGSTEVTRKVKTGNYDTAEMVSLAKARGAKIGVAYRAILLPGEKLIDLPSEWLRVATWKIKKNIIAGDDTVIFYAIDPAEAAALKANLQRFRSKLPETVEQTFLS